MSETAGKWLVRTGPEWSREVIADGATDAARKAFLESLPDMCGQLTECLSPDGQEFYIATEAVLNQLGHEVHDR